MYVIFFALTDLTMGKIKRVQCIEFVKMKTLNCFLAPKIFYTLPKFKVLCKVMNQILRPLTQSVVFYCFLLSVVIFACMWKIIKCSAVLNLHKHFSDLVESMITKYAIKINYSTNN